MSDMLDEMLRTLDRIVEDAVTLKMREAADERGNQGAAAKTDNTATKPLWAALEEAGFTALAGVGGDADVTFSDAMELVRRAAFHALPVPLGDSIMARRVRARLGLAEPDGLAALASPASCRDVVLKGTSLTGRVSGVPWGRNLDHLVVAVGDMVDCSLVVVDCRGAVVRQGANMAGEPRDEVDLGKSRILSVHAAKDAIRMIEAEGALLRAVQMSGAMGAVLDHCMTWVSDRVQFGKPISKHQAIQHLMAQLAEESAAASAAADLAVQASEQNVDRFSCAVAKARVGEAAGKSANLAHAIFGAMGFTREHQLHYATRRLWAWRNEFGGEAFWQRELGRQIAESGGSGLWPLITVRG